MAGSTPAPPRPRPWQVLAGVLALAGTAFVLDRALTVVLRVDDVTSWLALVACVMPGVAGLWLAGDARWLARGWHLRAPGDRFVVTTNVLVASILVILACCAHREPYRMHTSMQWGGVVIAFFGGSFTLAAKVANLGFWPGVGAPIGDPHAVVDSGLYGHVRHPGYLGMVVAWWGLALASYPPVLAIAACYTVTVVGRIVVEERALRVEVPAYSDYARRVRFRLLRGIW